MKYYGRLIVITDFCELLLAPKRMYLFFRYFEGVERRYKKVSSSLYKMKKVSYGNISCMNKSNLIAHYILKANA